MCEGDQPRMRSHRGKDVARVGRAVRGAVDSGDLHSATLQRCQRPGDGVMLHRGGDDMGAVVARDGSPGMAVSRATGRAERLIRSQDAFERQIEGVGRVQREDDA